MLWDSISKDLPMGDWILVGDFNVVLDPIDSSSPSLLIRGHDQESWAILDAHFDLIDLLIFLGCVRDQDSLNDECMEVGLINLVLTVSTSATSVGGRTTS